jgi:isoleucyl-tRNA synthetase
VNRIQRLRRDSGLEVSDRIRLAIMADGDAGEAAKRHAGTIAREVLAVEMRVVSAATGDLGASREIDLDGSTVRIALEPAVERAEA